MRIAALAAALSLSACMQAAAPQPTPYVARADAGADVDAMLARAALSGKRGLIVLGADWCHDSRALADLFETPRFTALIDERYEILMIDAGHPRDGKANNLEIARRFGVDELIGTPNLIIVAADGRRLNAVEDVTGWTDAAMRDPDEIYDFLLEKSAG